MRRPVGSVGPPAVPGFAPDEPLGIDAKVAFLRSPSSYDPAPTAVEIVETHMSWVFMTDREVYKLKKPVRWDGLDFSTEPRRHRHCLDELRLNRRLAPGVYRDVLALAVRADGSLTLGGPGRPVDWLVRMRRLPRERMLDTLLAEGRACDTEVRPVAIHLARFYQQAERIEITPPAFTARLARGTLDDLAALTEARALAPRDARVLERQQLEFLRRESDLLAVRLDAGRIVDGHGDLRPEHICVHSPPAIIDCLEFNADLRTLDPADELTYLALECERHGAPAVGGWFLRGYTLVTGDAPPPQLLHFYRRYRALRRAKLAVWHMREPGPLTRAAWGARAWAYLMLARSTPD